MNFLRRLSLNRQIKRAKIELAELLEHDRALRDVTETTALAANEMVEIGHRIAVRKAELRSLREELEE